MRQMAADRRCDRWRTVDATDGVWTVDAIDGGPSMRQMVCGPSMRLMADRRYYRTVPLIGTPRGGTLP
jgi:hypothetical protein